jgi:hypothetical protein
MYPMTDFSTGYVVSAGAGLERRANQNTMPADHDHGQCGERGPGGRVQNVQGGRSQEVAEEEVQLHEDAAASDQGGLDTATEVC